MCVTALIGLSSMDLIANRLVWAGRWKMSATWYRCHIMSSRLPFCLFSVFFANLDFKVQVSGNDSLGTANIAINLAAHLRGRQRYGEVGRDEAQKKAPGSPMFFSWVCMCFTEFFWGCWVAESNLEAKYKWGESLALGMGATSNRNQLNFRIMGTVLEGKGNGIQGCPAPGIKHRRIAPEMLWCCLMWRTHVSEHELIELHWITM